MHAADKVLAREEIARRIPEMRAARGPVVFTNGVFDLLHVGHVRYLEFARGLGGALIVAVNSDASVRALEKAPGRPIVPAEERAEIVAALACVDYVCVFDEERPDATLRVVRPDIHVKSAGYTLAQLPEAKTVAEIGADIAFAPHVDGISTTDLIARIRAAGA
ncbi:MAG: adenylyltransferase/cytidyltransferase family protein [Candidatus Eremiobacteraeota bacterium]|nr:adenylyltransferase/cytidyltransferase family protein [Candidatus Eremiobacteraeota bacterium]MBV8366780.1 adenylyltransferase/cytidyltransferase family protein [Candidatus Eremiobacteraeota bacterium]